MNSLLLNERDNMTSQVQNRLVAYDRQLGASRTIINSEPLVSTAGRNWRGFLVECHRVVGQEFHDLLPPYTLVGMHLGAPTRAEVRTDGPFEEKTFVSGDIAVIPAGTAYSVRFSEPAEFVVMSLDDEIMAKASQAANRGTDELKVIWGLKDSFLQETIQHLRRSIELNRPTDKMYAETLANSLALHLVRTLGQPTRSGKARGGTGLSREQLERTIEFIASTPYREISLSTMAKAAGLSPFHFSRMFKLSTGLSPHQFVLKRRLELGAELLVNSTTPISDIADELGFADQSHFTMHFKRLHRIAPAAYRRQQRLA